jgi:hypothetical protein
VNKEIAHLTHDRLSVTPERKLWNSVLGREILSIMTVFFTAMPERFRDANRRSDKYQTLAQVITGGKSYTTQDIHPTI